MALLIACSSIQHQHDNVAQQTDSGPYGSGWSAVHADDRNSDYSPVKGSENISLAWYRKFEGTINLGPTSDSKGQVYITTTAAGCHLYALDSRTGQTVWCSSEVTKYAVSSSPLLDSEGRIFIADDEAMFAFDGCGHILWKVSIEGLPLSAQFTQTGRLIFITHIGRIYVLDRRTGESVLQPINLISGDSPPVDFNPRACMQGSEKCPCANTLAFDRYSGKFFFTFWAPGATHASLWAMQYNETPVPFIQTLWHNDSLEDGSASSPDLSADGSRVYVNDNATSIHAIDVVTGKRIWTFDIGYKPSGSQSTSPAGIIMPSGGNGAPTMAVIDKGNDAQLLWRIDSLQNRGIATQTAGNVAYVTVKLGFRKYALVVMDVLSGRELDREALPGSPFFSVGTTIGPEGNVYVPTLDGYLYAYRPEQN